MFLSLNHEKCHYVLTSMMLQTITAKNRESFSDSKICGYLLGAIHLVFTKGSKLKPTENEVVKKNVLREEGA